VKDIDVELEFHFAETVETLVAQGWTEAAATAEAKRRFGNRHRYQRDLERIDRGGRLMEGVMQSLFWAERSLRQSPGFTTLALFTLTVGIGATTAAFSVLDTVILRSLPYPQSDRLVVLREQTRDGQLLPPSFPNFDDWRTRARSFQHVASTKSMSPQTVGVVGRDPMRVPSLGVSKDFFETLRVAPVAGRSFTPNENQSGGPSVVMVSYEFWQAQMSARLPLGTLRVGNAPMQVVGVLPPGFRFGSTADLYFPHEQGPGDVRNAHYLLVIARLAPGASVASARAEMSIVSSDLLSTYGTATQAVGVDITGLREYFVRGYRPILAVVFGGATLLLLIACTNVMSAQLSRGLMRGRDMAMRAALGAARGRLVRELLAESAMLAVLGGALGAALSSAVMHSVRSLGAGLLPRVDELQVNGQVLAFSIGCASAVVVVIGLYPALRLVGRDPVSPLRGALRSTGATLRPSVWRSLIGFEVAVALMLIVGSVLLIRTLHNILTADAGFDTHGVVTAALTPGSNPLERLEDVRAALAVLPGVEGAALSNQYPLEWGNISAPVLRPADPIEHDWPAFAGFRMVSPEYFSVLRQPIVRGRPFTARDREGSERVAVVTTGVAQRLWPGEDPIGKQVRTNYLVSELQTVVGIAQEASSWTMPTGSQNEIYVPISQHPSDVPSQIVVMVRARAVPSALLLTIRTTLRSHAGDMPAQVALLDERLARTTASRRFVMFAMAMFGGIALLLSAIGVYGVLTYSVASRRFEIGVRMALGATPSVVRGQLLRTAVVMTGTGVLVGGGVGLIVSRYVAALLYGVSRFDPAAYGIGAALLLSTSLLGAYVPARRSSRISPLVAMRGE
jgi:putative ABC transport system permease protein